METLGAAAKSALQKSGTATVIVDSAKEMTAVCWSLYDGIGPSGVKKDE